MLAALGFGHVAGLSVQIGWICLVVAVVILIVGVLGGRRPPIGP